MAEETKTDETTQGPVTFISRYLALRIVVNPGYSKEVDGRRVSVPGSSIRFEGGQFTTEDPEEIEFIRNRPEFGKHIQEVPQDVEKLAAHQDEAFQNLEEREAAVAAKEAEIEAREAAISEEEAGKAPEGNEEGAGAEGSESDGLEELDRPALLELLKTMKDEDPEGLDVNGNSKSEDIVAAIRAKRENAAAFED